MKRLIVIVVLLGAILAGSAGSAQAGAPPAYLCRQATLGSIIVDPVDGRYWKCSLKWLQGSYPYYYWKDIGWPA